MAQPDKKRGGGRRSFLYSLIKRSVLFLFLFLAVLLLLYFSGNFQAFLDSSLRIILFCASLTSIMLFSFCAIGLIAALALLLARGNAGYALDLLLYLLLALAAAAAFVFLRGLAVLTAGIR